MYNSKGQGCAKAQKQVMISFFKFWQVNWLLASCVWVWETKICLGSSNNEILCGLQIRKLLKILKTAHVTTNKWKNNSELGCDCAAWSYEAEGGNNWRVLVNKVVNLRVEWKSSVATVSFSSSNSVIPTIASRTIHQNAAMFSIFPTWSVRWITTVDSFSNRNDYHEYFLG